MSEKTYYEWAGPSYVKPWRGPLWYVALAVIVVVIIVWGFKTRDLYFVFAILLTLGVLVIYDHGQVPMALLSVDQEGVHIGDKFFDYDKLESYAIRDSHPRTLVFKTKIALRPFLEISVDHAEVDEIRAIMDKKLKRVDVIEEDPVGKAIRILRL